MMFPSLRCAIQVVCLRCGTVRTGDGHCCLLMPQLDRCYGSMPTSNLGRQVTGTTPCWPLPLHKQNVSFGQVSTNLQRMADGYAGTDQREGSRCQYRNSLCPRLTSVLSPLQKSLNELNHVLSNFDVRSLLEQRDRHNRRARLHCSTGIKARDAQCSMRSTLRN